ncbi:proteasome maturation factor UMP1 [Aureobasidium pullulans]|nr:proteasome maturation factor UMP1 [Aureobasidium pullulans]
MVGGPCAAAESCLEHRRQLRASFIIKQSTPSSDRLLRIFISDIVPTLAPYLTSNITHNSTAIMSLRMVPQKGHAQQTALAPSAPAAPGVHDTLRSNQSLNTPHNASPAFSAVASSHPLEARLSNWRSTQDSLKMTMLRREFGVGEPVRRGMEVKICQEGEWRPAVLGYKGEGVHEQILSGRDASVDWEDVFNGNETQNAPDFHSEMENKLKMNW